MSGAVNRRGSATGGYLRHAHSRWHRGRRHWCAAASRRRGDRQRSDRRRRPQHRRHGDQGDRRHRPCGHTGLRRHPHPPRRAIGVGSDRVQQLLPRHHQRRDGQLRCHLRTVQTRGPRELGGDDGERRGHSPRCDPRGAGVGLGDVRRVPRTASARLPKGLNVGGMVGHCALRQYAMGDRGIEREPPTRRRSRDDDRSARRGDARPEPWVSAPAARSSTRCPTVARCPARTPSPTSCSRSPTCSTSRRRCVRECQPHRRR